MLKIKEAEGGQTPSRRHSLTPDHCQNFTLIHKAVLLGWRSCRSLVTAADMVVHCRPALGWKAGKAEEYSLPSIANCVRFHLYNDYDVMMWIQVVSSGGRVPKVAGT